MVVVTAGLTGITLNTILQQPLPNRFLLTVLAVKDDTAVIAVNGRALEVHSEIPLQPGQTLLVSQEQGVGGEIRLRSIGDGTAPQPAGRPVAAGAARQIDLPTALRLADLPVTAEVSNKMAALLKTLGDDLSLPNLLAAVAFSNSGLASDQVLRAIASFLNSLPAQPQDGAPDEADANSTGSALKQAVLARAQGLVEMLQRLADQPEGSQKLQTVLQAFVAKNGESGRQAVGGQIYTWTQTDQDGHSYFYLPLHTILNNYGLRNCELYIYPPAGQQNDGNGQQTWLFNLTLETETLGWMQFKLAYQNRQVTIQAVVEQPGAKLALDDNWQLLAAGLSSFNLNLASERCDLGQVHSQTRSIQNLGKQFRQYNPFDISI